MLFIFLSLWAVCALHHNLNESCFCLCSVLKKADQLSHLRIKPSTFIPVNQSDRSKTMSNRGAFGSYDSGEGYGSYQSGAPASSMSKVMGFGCWLFTSSTFSFHSHSLWNLNSVCSTSGCPGIDCSAYYSYSILFPCVSSSTPLSWDFRVSPIMLYPSLNNLW